jgi:ubiquinone/menaquinone biosynthesis C-methylase UbiE
MEKTDWEIKMEKLSMTDIHAGTVAFYQIFIEKKKAVRILDLGAGSGKVAIDLAALPQVTGITAYDKSLELMRELESSDKIEKVTGGSHTELPFGDKSFDFVVCRYVFHHLDNKDRALKEINRILVDGGILFLSDPILPQHSKGVLNGIYRIREDSFYGYCDYHEMVDLLEENCFTPIMIRPYHHGYENLNEYLKAIGNNIDAEEYKNNILTKEVTVSVLKSKIARALNAVDELVRKEMKVTGSGLGLSFKYYIVDIASIKKGV